MTSTLLWVLALCDLCQGFSTFGASTRLVGLRRTTSGLSPHQLPRTPMMMADEEGDASADVAAAMDDATVADEPATVTDMPAAAAPNPTSVPDLTPPANNDDVDWEKLRRNLNPTKISKIVTNPITWKNGLYGGSLAFAVLLPLGMILAASK